MSRVHYLPLAVCAGVVSLIVLSAQAADQPPAPPAKDVLCQTATNKLGGDCHSPGSRAVVLKNYLTAQEKIAASQTATNVLKDCDKPPSKAALMQKAAPAAK
ncbi:MAG: hypothetical protein K0Q55_1082 [Verrucomicrobia bacterium]|jgi:hypothetical protein|nr:hypothetical protein [Verrucomicrobiota bacterium]